MISSLILGILSMGILLSINTSFDWVDENVKENILEQTKGWLGIVGHIFIWIISIMIPIYIFIVVTIFILNGNLTKINKKTYATSFGSLLLLSFLGILVASLMIPFIIAIPDSWFDNSVIPEEEVSGGINIVSYFTKWWMILGMMLMGIITGIIIRISINNKNKYSIKKWFNKILSYITTYFKSVIILVPFVIITRLSILGLSDIHQTGNILKLMGVYLGIYWFGALIILVSLILANIFLSKANITKKEKMSILLTQSLTVFANQNTQASLPTTQHNLMKLGVSKEITQLTPTKGMIMGMIMCNGFSPMLIVSLSLSNYGVMNVETIFMAIGMIMILSISTSGVGSADYTIILSTLGMFGISSAFYMTVVIPIQEINERTIARPNNTLGHMVATQITESVHQNKKNNQ